VAAKSRQFTADKTRKGQFFRGNRRNLAGEGVVKKSSSPQRVASVYNLCNSRSQGAGNMGNGSVAPVLASESIKYRKRYCRKRRLRKFVILALENHNAVLWGQ